MQRQLEFGCTAAGLNRAAAGAQSGIRPIEEIEQLMANGERHESVFDLS